MKYDSHLDDLSPAQLRAARMDAFFQFLNWLAQMATPMLLFLILWRVW